MSKVIVNLSSSRRNAFKRGFIKGLSAPVMLFGDFEVDPSIAHYEFQSLPTRKRGSMTGDWLRVGVSLKTSMKKVV